MRLVKALLSQRKTYPLTVMLSHHQLKICKNLRKLLDWYLKINCVLLRSNAQRLKAMLCITQDLLREDSIHMAVMWPRSDKDGQVLE